MWRASLSVLLQCLVDRLGKLVGAARPLHSAQRAFEGLGHGSGLLSLTQLPDSLEVAVASSQEAHIVELALVVEVEVYLAGAGPVRCVCAMLHTVFSFQQSGKIMQRMA